MISIVESPKWVSSKNKSLEFRWLHLDGSTKITSRAPWILAKLLPTVAEIDWLDYHVSINTISVPYENQHNVGGGFTHVLFMCILLPYHWTRATTLSQLENQVLMHQTFGFLWIMGFTVKAIWNLKFQFEKVVDTPTKWWRVTHADESRLQLVKRREDNGVVV